MNILDCTHNQFAEVFRRRYGQGSHYSTPLYRRVMKTGSATGRRQAKLPLDPELLERLETELMRSAGRIVKQVSDGSVVKYVTRLRDDREIESVVIPMYNRHTLCVSSQVGCRMGCRFCATGKAGLIRNLTAAEIVGQVFAARYGLGFGIRNVVFMGMGEPLDNLDNVVQAIRVLTDQRGLDIARRHITVSTVGLTAGIHHLARIDGLPVNLAVSLNAPSDEIRSSIMPINRSNPMAALRAALLKYPLAKKSTFFMAYVLIEGVNDRREDAKSLVQYLAPMKAKLNLIPYNPAPGCGLTPPSAHTYEQFHDWLVAEKVFVRRRAEKGARIMAACGQLSRNHQVLEH